MLLFEYYWLLIEFLYKQVLLSPLKSVSVKQPIKGIIVLEVFIAFTVIFNLL